MGDSVHIGLLGTSFSIQTDQDPDYVASLVAFLKDKVRQIEQSAGAQDHLKTAILVALLTADELFRLRATNRAPESDGQIDEITKRLIERIDSVLDEKSR